MELTGSLIFLIGETSRSCWLRRLYIDLATLFRPKSKPNFCLYCSTSLPSSLNPSVASAKILRSWTSAYDAKIARAFSLLSLSLLLSWLQLHHWMGVSGVWLEMRGWGCCLHILLFIVVCRQAFLVRLVPRMICEGWFRILWPVLFLQHQYCISFRVRIIDDAICSFVFFVWVVLQYSQLVCPHDVWKGDNSSLSISTCSFLRWRCEYSWCHA